MKVQNHKNRLTLFLFLFLALIPSTGLAITVRAFIGIESPTSFHPNDCADGIMADHLNQVFETLFWIDYEGNLVPALATEWKRIDSYRVRVQLRRDVRFQNGEIFNAGAAVYSFKQFTDPANKVANRFYGSTIARAEIVDDYTVDIVTNAPDSLLPYRLAIVGMIIPPKYHQRVGKAFFSKHPIGTGSFKYVGLASNGRLILEANETYWGGQPAIDRLELSYFKSVDEAVKALLDGDIDFVAHAPGMYSKSINQNKELVLKKQLTRQSIFVLINTKKDGPLRSLEFRTALRNGLNFADVIEYGHNGNGVIANSLTVKGEPFHNETLPAIPYWPGVARNYVRSHNLQGYQFQALITKPYDLAGRIAIKQMRALGLHVDDKYGSDIDEINAVLKQNQAGQIPNVDFLMSYCAHRYALGAFPMLVLLHSKGNWSLTSDPALDALMDDAMSDFDFQKQSEKFRAANRYIYDNALVIPGFQHLDVFGMARWLEFRPHVTGYVYFKDMRVRQPD